MTITITALEDATFAVASPYNRDFVAKCREVGGRFDRNTKEWVFPNEMRDSIEESLADIYGWTNGEVQEVVVVCPKGDEESKGPFVISGVIIATAWGRDSGAKAGPGVVFLEGGCHSGGSRANWQTVIRANSRIRVKLPVGAELPAGWKYEDPEGTRRAELEARAEKLKEELAQVQREIEALGK